MSSPKKSDYIDYEKKIIRNDTKTIIRIHEGGRLYGTLRISNMIPVPITELEPYIQLFGAKQVCSLKLYATQRLHKFYI